MARIRYNRGGCPFPSSRRCVIRNSRGYVDSGWLALLLLIALFAALFATVFYVKNENEKQRQEALDRERAIVSWAEQVGIATGFNAQVVKSCECREPLEYRVKLIATESYNPAPPKFGDDETFFAKRREGTAQLVPEQMIIIVVETNGNEKKLIIQPP